MSKCLLGIEQDCTECRMYNTEKKISNGDRIRRMTDEELANLISKLDNLHRVTCLDSKELCDRLQTWICMRKWRNKKGKNVNVVTGKK